MWSIYIRWIQSLNLNRWPINTYYVMMRDRLTLIDARSLNEQSRILSYYADAVSALQLPLKLYLPLVVHQTVIIRISLVMP